MAKPTGPMGLPLNVIGAVLGVIIVIALILVFTGHSNSGTASTSIATTVAGGNGAASTTVSGTGSGSGNSGSNVACGPGNYCMNKSETSSFIGQNISYSATYGTSQLMLEAGLGDVGAVNANATAIYDNLTGVYILAANNSISNSTGNTLVEIALKAKNGNSAKWEYRNLFNSSGGITYSVTNATLNGLTYSYYGYSVPLGNNVTSAGTIFVGYKNNATAFVYVMGSELNSAKLATTVAGDLP